MMGNKAHKLSEREIWGERKWLGPVEKMAWVDLTVSLNQHLGVCSTPEYFGDTDQYNNRVWLSIKIKVVSNIPRPIWFNNILSNNTKSAINGHRWSPV
jgi:hypothetical protein